MNDFHMYLEFDNFCFNFCLTQTTLESLYRLESKKYLF